MTLDDEKFENNPPTLDPLWREVSGGIYRLEKELLVVLDVPRLLNTVHG
jgi:purine-binding chemotaxis protein CheW